MAKEAVVESILRSTPEVVGEVLPGLLKRKPPVRTVLLGNGMIVLLRS